MEHLSAANAEVNPLTNLRAGSHKLESLAQKNSSLVLMLILGDIVALTIAFTLAYVVRFLNPLFPYEGPTSTLIFYSPIAFVVIPLWLFIFASHGLYNIETLFGG